MACGNTRCAPAQEWQVEHAPHVQGLSGRQSDLPLVHHPMVAFFGELWRLLRVSVMAPCPRRGAVGFLALLVTFTSIPVAAQDRLPPAPLAYKQLADPALEDKAATLMHELRCLVCQGQSIADSDAPLAGDMRHEVRSRIAAGESPDAVRAWLIARYGKWVTYDPPFDAATAFLWLGPLAFLLAGLWLARSRFVSRMEDKP
jgi:cytochrome c-type biogenesis protein CcmH